MANATRVSHLRYCLESNILSLIKRGMNYAEIWVSDSLCQYKSQRDAIETAMGESRQGEGVSGLRRAFHLAGARTIVMSQWEIPDEETVTLMTGFYSRWQSGSGKSQALREASLSLMRKHRKEHGATHPYYWGAFVCVGEP